MGDSDGESVGLYRGRTRNGQRVGFVVRPGPQVKALLNDSSPSTFDDSGLPFGPGDWSAGFEWSLTVPASESWYDVAEVLVSSRVPGCSVKGDILVSNGADVLLCRPDTSRCWIWACRIT